MTDPKPDASAGKKLKGELGVIDVDSDVLRNAARELQQHAESLAAIPGKVDNIGSTAEHEAAAWTETHDPAPIYQGAVTSLKTVGSKFSEQVNKLITQLNSDASALMWIAENHDTTEDENKQNMDKIDPNVGGHGGSGGAPKAVSVSAHGGKDDDDWFTHDNGYVPPTTTGGAAAGPSAVGTPPIHHVAKI